MIDRLNDAWRDRSQDPQFDLNINGQIDINDSYMWIVEIYKSWPGDANLDGEFNSRDLVEIFQVGKYETDEPAGWAEGNWLGDGFFNAGDFVYAF